MKTDQIYLRHILDAIEKIDSYVSVGRDVFMTTSHWQDATIRQLEIIGEATKRLSKALRSSHLEIPWRRIAGLRDVLIHDYLGVDLEAVWQITQKDMPKLRISIEKIVRNMES